MAIPKIFVTALNGPSRMCWTRSGWPRWSISRAASGQRLDPRRHPARPIGL